MASIHPFHITLHACSASAPRDLATPFAVTFEQASAALGRLERLFIEPDGSFVWTPPGEEAWQVDGMLYDRQQRLLYVELKGRCPADRFDQLLAAFGWPGTPVLVQHVREGILLTEAEFRRQLPAASCPTAEE